MSQVSVIDRAGVETVLDAESEEKYICCNADEGDSGTFADRLLMEADPYQLVEGMTIAGLAVGAAQGYIYLRSEYPRALRTLPGRAVRPGRPPLPLPVHQLH